MNIPKPPGGGQYVPVPVFVPVPVPLPRPAPFVPPNVVIGDPRIPPPKPYC